MDRRYLPALFIVLAAIIALSFALGSLGPTTDSPLDTEQQYREGAGPKYINFSILASDSNNVSHTPRKYWDSYAIIYTEPPEHQRVEGDYYINSSTGEVISNLWYGAKDYRNNNTYAYVQPAESIPDKYQREQFEADLSFVYANTTDAYYRYDSHYGRVSPTNIGRHTNVLMFYTWEATNTATHHGVPVITYQLVEKAANNSRVPPAINGTLQLGAEDGIIYAFDITLDDSEGTYRYTYDVSPAAFPDHDWVDAARKVAVANSSTDNSTERQLLHASQ